MAEASEPDPDYYEILDVPETASAQEITRAYRRLVRRLHPDTNRSADPRRLQDAIDAYQVIGDPVRRSRYDASRARRRSPPGGGTRIPVRHVGSPEPRQAARRRRAATATSAAAATAGDIVVAFDEAQRGAMVVVDVHERQPCPSCRGRGEQPMSRTTCPDCRGAGLTTRRSNRITVRQECPTCHGQGRSPCPCRDCEGAGVVSSSWPVRVEIPPGVQDGTRIALPGRAGSSPLYATVRVRARDR